MQNPRRVGSPETDHANPFDPRSPVVQAGRDVIPPKDERAGIVTTSDRPGGWGEDSGGAKPRKASTVGTLSGAPTPARTRRGNKALKAAAPARLPSGGRAAGNVRRARAPRGAPLAHEGNTLKGQAQGRSGASRAGRAGGVRREGGSQTPHVARGDGGNRHQLSCGSTGPRVCRRARELRRGSIAGRVGQRPSGQWATLRCGAAMARLRRSTKAQGGPASVFESR
mgnify:FL=1